MLEQFREVVLADFEFGAASTHRPEVVCLVAHELHSGRTIRLWRDEMGSAPPYDTGPDTLFIAFFASAELDCHRALGWSIPTRIIDLYCEFRDRFNGLPTIAGNGLLGALAQFGLDGVGSEAKKEMRDLAMRGGPWTSAERAALLDYCESDVVATKRLLLAMLPAIDIPRALLRGRYMAAVSAMQHAGVPTDTDMHDQIIRPRHLRRNLLEQFQPFAAKPVFEIHEAGNVAAWPRQAIDEARADRIGHGREHDRQGAGEMLQCRHADGGVGQEDVRCERDQFLRVSARPVGIVLAPADVDPYIAGIAPAQLLQGLLERREAGLRLRIVCGPAHEYANASHSLRLLRARR